MAGVIFALYCFRFFSLGSYLREKGFIQRGNQLIQKNIVNKEGTKEWHMEFLDSGRKCWTLDSGLWTLDPVPWTLDSWQYTLDAGVWALDTIIDCFRTKPEVSFWFCLIKLLNIFWVQISKDLMVTLVV